MLLNGDVWPRNFDWRYRGLTALHTAPFGGITAYQVLDTVIALRDTDARRIALQ